MLLSDCSSTRFQKEEEEKSLERQRRRRRDWMIDPFLFGRTQCCQLDVFELLFIAYCDCKLNAIM
jgi:hypothetical protein